MSSDKAPIQALTGGCLCGQIRYTIKINDKSGWPLDPHTCWCSQCRKFNGAILIHLLTIIPSEIEWEGKDKITEYDSSAEARRGFCAKCGTSLYFRYVGVTHELELCTGTVDEEILDDAKLAMDLCDPVGGRFWCRREIKSAIYEGSSGTRYWHGSTGRVMCDDE